MVGHHIYTSSYFKYGSHTRNPGTYTVELTQDIFGADTDEVIFKLNQMCASVPESLTPRNTNESILRLYHILPDTTIVTRSWFVTDEITNRGTVPYSHSLIFRGSDNEKFLKNPAKAFDINSAEPYKSYLERVNIDSPTKLSTKYDPREEDYSEPFAIRKDDWITQFGMDSELFAKYYISLGRAVCGKGSSRVAVILPKGMDGERLILATLSLLPQFMKRKFAAVSKWTGMMDGSGSTAVNGIQLLCYYDELPVSESGFPIIDLTGQGRHANIATPTGPESGYAAWIWQNLDDRGKISEYDQFIEANFSSVLSKIPFEVIANTYVLWMNKNIEHCSNKNLTLMMLLIAGSFAKNFPKFDFISNTLERITIRLLNNADITDYDGKTVQAACVLAANGSAGAKELVDALFDAFRKVKNEEKNDEYWEKLFIVLQYYRSVYETGQNNPDKNKAISKLYESLSFTEKNQKCEKIAHEALIINCRHLRDTILTDKEDSDKAFSLYKIRSVVFKNVFGLPDTFFQLKDEGKNHAFDAERFFELEKFDIETLGYVPTIQHWIQAIDYAENLTVQRRAELWMLYYSKIKENKEEYISTLEKEKKAIVGGQNQVLTELCDSEEAAAEIAGYYREKFNTAWISASHPMDSDETWRFMHEWIERLHKVPPIKDVVLPYFCEKIGLTRDDVAVLAERLSAESVKTAARLYKKDEPVYNALNNIIKVDARAEFRELMFFSDMVNGFLKSLSINRLKYWYDKLPDPPLEWAVEIASSYGTSGHSFISHYLDLRMRKTSRLTEIAQAIELFKLVNILPADNKTSIINSLKSKLCSIDRECFKDFNVQMRFGSIKESMEKKDIGLFIYNFLSEDRNMPEEIMNVYSPHNRKRGYTVVVNDEPEFDYFSLRLLTIFFILFAGIAQLILFCFSDGAGPARIAEFMGKGFALVVPYVLSGLILITTIISVISLLRNGGNES